MVGDAAWLGALGASAAAVALAATLADRRRIRRTDLDRVGFMPWTAIYFVALLVACVTLGLAARAWFAA